MTTKIAWMVTSDIRDSRTQRVERGVVCYCNDSLEEAERFAVQRRRDAPEFADSVRVLSYPVDSSQEEVQDAAY